MLFNSLQFAVFFVVVYGLYLVFAHKGRNRLLLAASYFFYACWDWRFLSLLILSTVIDYICGLQISRSLSERRRKRFLVISLLGNLGILGFFKYFGFFLESFNNLLSLAGLNSFSSGFNIILPVGISFYTFQSMSYTIDIYRGRVRPLKSFRDFALYVSFFPQLVAGPIERAERFVPQVAGERKITAAGIHEGGYLIFWGLFQKIVIADNLARLVDPVFAEPAASGSLAVLIATYAFAFQIYCDFAGYSNMARGLGLLMGFDIMVNFNLPYFCTNPSAFWRRWHISLSSWLRDYLYIPLGGSHGTSADTCVNLLLVMALGGLWHGASWNFVFWGFYHGLLLGLYFMFSPKKETVAKIPEPLLTIGKLIAAIVFFHFVCFGWILFRAGSLSEFVSLITVLFSGAFVTDFSATLPTFSSAVFYAAFLLCVDGLSFVCRDRLAVLRMPVLLRAVFYTVCFYLLLFSGVGDAKQFIYFQF